jgi:hypothetical protein
VRLFLMLAMVMLTACGPSANSAGGDETKESWYPSAVAQLAQLARDADSAFAQHKGDQAAALIEKGTPIENRLMRVNRPTLDAEIAASDLDDLYGRMLLSNRHFGWARLMFQKNLARWKHWTPETPDTIARRQHAQSQIDECDKNIPQ